MNDIIIGKGNLEDKGVYSNRNFKKGEVVIKYNLKSLTKEEYKKLPRNLKGYVHSHWGKLYLYSIPERYVNHSKNPNTLPDHKQKADVAIKDVKKGEKITTDHTKDDIN